MLARSCASVCEKLPVICAWPPGIELLTYGEETTWPSRTMANSFCGLVWVASLPVVVANSLLPCELKFRLTCQPVPLVLFRLALALETSLPSTATGPSAYLYQTPLCGFWEQATASAVVLVW